MKKILSIFLLSAMLVLVLGACESGEDKLSEAKEARKEHRQEETIEKLERQVEALMLESRWLHYCAQRNLQHSSSYPDTQHSKCGGAYEPISPFRSLEAFNAWGKKDYP